MFVAALLSEMMLSAGLDTEADTEVVLVVVLLPIFASGAILDECKEVVKVESLSSKKPGCACRSA